jgi:flagellar basal-body rod protein FlgG
MAFDSALLDASRGALLQQQHMDILSNNLANVNTNGYKGDRLIFDDVLSRQVQTAHTQGPLHATDNPLDVAIGGSGFFRVQTANGVRLTRDGAFKMLSDGSLVTSQGYKVLGGGGAPVTINPEGPQPYIDDKGAIMQNNEQVGILDVVDVADTKTLVKVGNNLYSGQEGKAPATTPAANYSLTQGAVETANVEVVTEMVNMISSFRSFESYQKIIQAVQEMDTKTVNQVGRVG